VQYVTQHSSSSIEIFWYQAYFAQIPRLTSTRLVHGAHGRPRASTGGMALPFMAILIVWAAG
jgi:hypothetical protein